ncbi:hypothetical protein EDB86DRAFT_2827681 [Lactarius hatsudake]|nr:hypothetical protein EDB86DRAFT_2827681 [Lactarius hatsudake]
MGDDSAGTEMGGNGQFRAQGPGYHYNVLSILLHTRAGQGTWGWAGVACAEGWVHLPSSCVCGQGRAGWGMWGWAGVACAEGDWGGYTVLRAPAGRGCSDMPSCTPFLHEWGRCWKGRGQGAAGPCECGGPGTGNGLHAPYLHAKGWQQSMQGTEWVSDLQWCTMRGKGKGGRGRREERGCTGARIGTGQFWTLWQKQVVPATSVKRCTMIRGMWAHHSPAPPFPTSAPFMWKGAQRTVYPPQSPSAQATPAQPHMPHLTLPCLHTQEEGRCTHPSTRATLAQPHAPHPAHMCKRTDGASSPTLSMHTRGGTVRTAQPSLAWVTPAQPHTPCPHLQEEGRCAHPSVWATPVQPPATHAHKGEGQRVHLLLMGYASPAFTHPTTPVHPKGCKRGYMLHPRRGACKGEGHMHTHKGGTQNEGQCNPSVSGEVVQRDRHIRVRVQKGVSDGKGVVNEVKQSQGKAVRANGGHPTPVD